MEARAILREFRDLGSRSVEEIGERAEADGVSFDYSISSLPCALKWILSNVQVCRVPVSLDEPLWVRQAHSDGFIEFKQTSKGMVLSAAFYLGECFARLPGLTWGIGDPEFLEKNMPVVTGFRDDEELPPIVVVENVFARILGKGAPIANIDSTINVWMDECPSASA